MSIDSKAKVHDLLSKTFGANPQVSDNAFVTSGMSVVELVRVHEIVLSQPCQSALEIGMACGTSSVVIADALRRSTGGILTSIDPYQSAPDAYDGKGLKNIDLAGLTNYHICIQDPDYLALPSLLREGKRYDFVFIDGWHSFDYMMIDFFYADLLLNDGGFLLLHDSSSPPIFEFVQWLESNKPYLRIGPRPLPEMKSLWKRAARRVVQALSGQIAESRERSKNWRTLAAYRKLATRRVPQYPVDVNTTDSKIKSGNIGLSKGKEVRGDVL